MKDTTIQLHRSTTIGGLYAFVAQDAGPGCQRFVLAGIPGKWGLHSAEDLEQPMGAKISTIGVHSHTLKTYTHLTPAEVVFSSSFNLEDVFCPRPYLGREAVAGYEFDVSAMHPTLPSQHGTDDLTHHEISIHLTRPDGGVTWLVSESFTLYCEEHWANVGDALLPTLISNMGGLLDPILNLEYEYDRRGITTHDNVTPQTRLQLRPRFCGRNRQADPIEVPPSGIKNFLGLLEWV